MSDPPARPALADVLGALTTTTAHRWEGILEHGNLELQFTPRGVVSRLLPDRDTVVRLWVTTDVREALELLQTRGLAPEDDVRRGFACSKCNGRGHMLDGDPYEGDGTGSPWACPVCKGKTPRSEHPLNIPDLIAWASLGVPAILRAEELARETVRRLREYGAPQPERVVWRVCRRSALGTKMLGNFYQMHSREHNPVPPAGDLWDMGLALDAITADAVTLVVPNVGAT